MMKRRIGYPFQNSKSGLEVTDFLNRYCALLGEVSISQTASGTILFCNEFSVSGSKSSEERK